MDGEAGRSGGPAASSAPSATSSVERSRRAPRSAAELGDRVRERRVERLHRRGQGRSWRWPQSAAPAARPSARVGDHERRAHEARASTPAGVRWKGVSSAPESVVGIAATGAPVDAADRLGGVDHRPPPSATSGRSPASGRAPRRSRPRSPGRHLQHRARRRSSGALRPRAVGRQQRVVARSRARPSRSGASAGAPGAEADGALAVAHGEDRAQPKASASSSPRARARARPRPPVVRERVRQRPQVGLAGRLEDVRRHSRRRTGAGRRSSSSTVTSPSASRPPVTADTWYSRSRASWPTAALIA